MKKITKEADYNKLMDEILILMNKGEGNLSSKELTKLRSMALAAQAYEKSIYTVPAPSTIEGMIELTMYRQKLKQKDLAKLLGTGEAKLSQILSGKRKPDVPFLKAVYQKLKIDPGFLLEHA